MDTKTIISSYQDLVRWVNRQDSQDMVSDIAGNLIADAIYKSNHPPLKTDWTEFLLPWQAKIASIANVVKAQIDGLEV